MINTFNIYPDSNHLHKNPNGILQIWKSVFCVLLTELLPEAQTYTTSGQKYKETKSQKHIIFIQTIINVVVVIFIVIITGAGIPENTNCSSIY